MKAYALAAVIVGAGAGKRFGGPKAGATLADGRRFVDAIAEIAAAAGLDPIIAVLPPGMPAPAPHGARVVTVVNANPDSEQIASIRLGLSQLVNVAVSAALIWPVDHPFVRLESVLALIDAARRTDARIAVPVDHARRGHPTLFHRDVWRELMTVRADGARGVLRASALRVCEVLVHDIGVLRGITTREDLDGSLSPTDRPPHP